MKRHCGPSDFDGTKSSDIESYFSNGRPAAREPLGTMVDWCCRAAGWVVVAVSSRPSHPSAGSRNHYCRLRADRRSIAVRVIGAAVFFTYFCYLFISLDSPYYSRRLGIDFEVKPWVVVLKALAGLLLWGVPGLYVMITGKFPWWWRKRSDNTNNEDKRD